MHSKFNWDLTIFRDQELIFQAHLRNDICVTSFRVQIGTFVDEPETVVPDCKTRSGCHIDFVSKLKISEDFLRLHQMYSSSDFSHIPKTY